MTLGSSVNILHWFVVVVVVWQTGPWCTFYISGTFTNTVCVRANTQADLCTSQCKENQWVHVVSKKFQVGCPQTNTNYTLQTNTSQSLTVTCAGRQQTSGLCPYNCLEHVTPPDTYSGNNTSVTLENECIDESFIHNMCGDLSDTPTNQQSLASPSLFLAPGPSPLTRCRCQIHAQHLDQVEILFADINTSVFTITCGQQIIVSDGNFTTNVTNTVMSLPVNSSDCVIDVDRSGAQTTDGLPPHRVWTKFTGSSITFNCNKFSSPSTPSSSSSSSSSESTTTMTASPTTTVVNSSTVPPTSSSVSMFASHTTSNETTTTNDTTTEGNWTASPTTGDTTTGAQVDQTVPYPYIIAGVAGGVVLVIIILVIVIVVRKKRGGVKYATSTEDFFTERSRTDANTAGLHHNSDLEETLPKSKSFPSESDPQCGEDNSRIIMNAAYQPLHDELHNNHYEVSPKKNKPQPHDGVNALSKSKQKGEPAYKTAKNGLDDNGDDVVMFVNDAYESFSSLQQQNIPEATRELDGEGSQREADSLQPKSQPATTKGGDQHPSASTNGNTSSTRTWEDDYGDDEMEMTVNDLYVSAGEITPIPLSSATSA